MVISARWAFWSLQLFVFVFFSFWKFLQWATVSYVKASGEWIHGKTGYFLALTHLWHIRNEKFYWLSEIGLTLLSKVRVTAIELHAELGGQVLFQLCLQLTVWPWGHRHLLGLHPLIYALTGVNQWLLSWALCFFRIPGEGEEYMCLGLLWPTL